MVGCRSWWPCGVRRRPGGRLIAGIAGSNLDESMGVRLVYLLCTMLVAFVVPHACLIVCEVET
jgi:hypothetical protein